MSAFPDFSTTLLKISSLFASPGWQHAERMRFAAMDLRLATYHERARQLLNNLTAALSLEPADELWHDFLIQLLRFGELLDARALHAASFGADARQVLWALGRDLAPGLGRTWGFWCLDEPIMPDLPGGDLWFLPHVHPDRSEALILPVEAVARWWRGLLDGPIDAIWQGEGDDRHRTFQTWLAGKATPDPRKIVEWYADDREFRYRLEVATPPETRTIRTLLLWARALEAAWKDLVSALTPDVAPDVADPMRNKALQLVELFRLAHHLTIASKASAPEEADALFQAAVPDWLARGAFRALLRTPEGRLPAAEECAVWLTEHFMSLVPGAPLEDIFRDAALDAPATPVPDVTVRADRAQLVASLNAGHAALHSVAPDRAALVEAALAEAQANPRAADMEADISYLSALDAVSKGDFDTARALLDRGLALCSGQGFGPVRLEMARLRLALSVAEEAFNQNRCEAAYRVLSRSIPPEQAERWLVGEAPWEHSMRLAAAELSQWFWQEALRPYPGAEIEAPLEENAAIFQAYATILYTGADEPQIRAFLADHKGVLKCKLRDVRGDTFFTMATKMVSYLTARLRAMPPIDDMHGSSSPTSPRELAASMLDTHHRVVRLLPTDVLNARDYLGQTALILAADRGDAELLEVLIARSVDLDAQDTLGRTALHAAARSNAPDCFRMLLEAGADPTRRTCEGKTPTILAAELGRERIFMHSLEHVRLKVTDEELREAYRFAAQNERQFKQIRAAYGKLGVKLGGRGAFREIMAATDRRRREPGL